MRALVRSSLRLSIVIAVVIGVLGIVQPGRAAADDVNFNFHITGGPVCADGLDNDGDGRTDFPQDPDCVSAGDTSESPLPETVGAGKAQCADGLDNDGDGQVDFPADPDCLSADDNIERPSLQMVGSDGETIPKFPQAQIIDGIQNSWLLLFILLLLILAFSAGYAWGRRHGTTRHQTPSDQEKLSKH